MIGVGFDVTERQEADSARRASEARYRLVVESAKEVIFQLDSELRWSLLNSAWVEIFGFELDESLGRRVTDFVHPMDRDRVARDLRALSAGELSSLENEVRFLSKTGDVIWMDALARRVVDDPGEPGAADSIVGTLSNITERRLAEEQLLATTSLQDAILNGANYSILSWRSDGTIQLFNRAAEKLLGYQAREVVDRANPLLFHDAQELAQRSQQIAESRGLIVAPGLDVLTALARDGGVDEHEWTYIRRNGSRFPVRLSVTALRGPEREVVGYVAFGYDLTDTRRVERLKNEFVSVVSHELRTPLTSIRGALGLLAGGVAGVLPENAANMIGIAQKNSERLVLLINDILDVEKIESGKMRFDLAPVPLGQLLQSAVDANQPYAESLGVSILVEARDADLARMTVTGDEARLMQVLANLLSNASKFTPEGGVVRLRLERTTNHPVGEWARILVQDTGPGVPESFVSSLFEKFAQADASSTRRQGGTGLGLAIARAIVDKHGGQIGYLPPDPERGRAGATFFFDLPVYPGDAGEKADVPVADDRPTILICEDDGEVAQLISMILDHGGFRTERVYGVAQARAALARKRYAAMTLDLLLPDGDGFELLRHLRAEASTRDLPVVVVSTERKTADQLSVFALGVVDWLHKPIDAPRLLEAVGRLSRPPHGIPRILHVEDDRDVRQVTEAIVGNAGFVVPASSLREARTQLMTSHFDLVILDIALPDGSGLDLVPLLNGAAPPIPVILFSAREPFEHEAVDVSAALVKSRTSNEALLETIEGLLNS